MNLLKAYEENTDAFISLIQEFPESKFNNKPDESTWSAAENVDHIIRSEFGTARLFNAATEQDPDRNSDAMIQKIETQFLDRGKKLQAFGVVLPSDGEKSKEDLIERFRTSRSQVIKLIKTQNMDEICLKFEHPLFGHMTRREWVHFNITHTKRHMDQILELK